MNAATSLAARMDAVVAYCAATVLVSVLHAALQTMQVRADAVGLRTRWRKQRAFHVPSRLQR